MLPQNRIHSPTLSNESKHTLTWNEINGTQDIISVRSECLNQCKAYAPLNPGISNNIPQYVVCYRNERNSFNKTIDTIYLYSYDILFIQLLKSTFCFFIIKYLFKNWNIFKPNYVKLTVVSHGNE